MKNIYKVGGFLIVIFMFMIFASCNKIENNLTTNTYLTIDSVYAVVNNSAKEGQTYIESDVCILDEDTGSCSVESDTAEITVRNVPLNPDLETSFYSDIRITRYKVEFYREDGKNRKGIDIPYPVSGYVNVNVPVGETVKFFIVVVPQMAKLQPPLSRLVGGNSETIIKTVARITIYGEDPNGNQISAEGQIDVYFADFADSE